MRVIVAEGLSDVGTRARAECIKDQSDKPHQDAKVAPLQRTGTLNWIDKFRDFF